MESNLEEEVGGGGEYGKDFVHRQPARSRRSILFSN